MRKLKQKINEALASVIPITLIVFILSITIAPLPLGMMLMFLAGALLLVAGMGFFALGAELSMMPIGEGAGSELVKSRRLPIIILVTFAMGVIITAAEPFAVHAPDAAAHKIPVNVVVGKAAAVAVHGGLLEHDLIGHAAGAERRVLLRHAPLHIALCVADLQQALIVGVVLLVGIDHRMSIRPPGEKLRVTHRRHRPTPSALSWTQ